MTQGIETQLHAKLRELQEQHLLNLQALNNFQLRSSFGRKRDEASTPQAWSRVPRGSPEERPWPGALSAPGRQLKEPQACRAAVSGPRAQRDRGVRYRGNRIEPPAVASAAAQSFLT